MNNQKEKKVVVILLNYINYSVTNECVQSIIKQNYNNFQILIVDNGSNNESYHFLKNEYSNIEKVTVIRTGKNYGFARGNNIGIQYAKKELGAEYVMLLNSDTLVEDSNYINKMIETDGHNIGVIGSKAELPDNTFRGEMQRYVTFPATLFYFLAKLSEYTDHPVYQAFWAQKLMKYESTNILEGHVLVLTPTYFQYFEGLDPRTFLYCEEELLYLRCRVVGLEEKLNENACLYHKFRQSSKILFGNENEIYMKLILSSYRFVLLESIRMFMIYGIKSKKHS